MKIFKKKLKTKVLLNLILEELKEINGNTAKIEQNCRIATWESASKDDDIKKLEQQLKTVTKERDSYKQDLGDIEEQFDLKRCDSCGRLTPEVIMSYIGNEEICESCRVNGYGR